MSKLIPAAVISVCSEIISNRETHDSLDSLFQYAGASGEIPNANKRVKAQTWMRNTNLDKDADPLKVLGRLLEGYMEDPLDPSNQFDLDRLKERDKIYFTLESCDLKYVKGGNIIGTLGPSSRNLEFLIKEFDFESLDSEFQRALENVNKNPREALSAASNIIESICKVYISEEDLEMPSKQDLKSVWTIVRKHLGFEPQFIEEKDLQQILTGLISIVDGIGALRTHASSAHGAGKKVYKIESRHARLAIHSAHTISLFILETWKKKKANS